MTLLVLKPETEQKINFFMTYCQTKLRFLLYLRNCLEIVAMSKICSKIMTHFSQLDIVVKVTVSINGSYSF